MTSRSKESMVTAIAALLFVIVAYPAFAFLIKQVLSEITISGYSIKWGILPTVFVALGCLWWHLNRGGSWKDLGFFTPEKPLRAALLAIISVPVIYGLVALIISLLLGVDLIASPDTDSKLTIDGPNRTVSIVLSLLVMWLVAAVGEEIIFRGFLLKYVANALGDTQKHWVVAVILISILFGLAHIPAQGGYGFVITGLVGLLLGFLFLIGKRNLWVVILAHGLINSLSVI